MTTKVGRHTFATMYLERGGSVEVLQKLMPPLLGKIISYLVDALIALFFFILLQQGYLLAVNNIMMASTFQMSMTWILVAVPVAAALTLLQVFLRIVKKIFEEFSYKQKPSA